MVWPGLIVSQFETPPGFHQHESGETLTKIVPDPPPLGIGTVEGVGLNAQLDEFWKTGVEEIREPLDTVNDPDLGEDWLALIVTSNVPVPAP